MKNIAYLEQLRCKIRNKMLIWIFVVTLIAYFLAQVEYTRNLSWKEVLTYEDYTRIGVLIFIYIGFIVVAVVTSTEKLRNQMCTTYIDQIIIPELNQVFDDVEFHEITNFMNKDRRITIDDVNESGLVRVGNTLQSSNSITGMYQGVHFRKANINLNYKRNLNKEDSYPFEVFSGSFIVLKLDRQPVDEVYVISDKFNSSNRLNRERMSKLVRIQLESVAFNKEFSVYSIVEKEVFYVLTPKAIEGLLNYPTLKGVGISKKGNEVYIALKDQFTLISPKLFQRVDETVGDAIKVDIQTIKDAIHIFAENV